MKSIITAQRRLERAVVTALAAASRRARRPGRRARLGPHHDHDGGPRHGPLGHRRPAARARSSATRSPASRGRDTRRHRALASVAPEPPSAPLCVVERGRAGLCHRGVRDGDRAAARRRTRGLPARTRALRAQHLDLRGVRGCPLRRPRRRRTRRRHRPHLGPHHLVPQLVLRRGRVGRRTHDLQRGAGRRGDRLGAPARHRPDRPGGRADRERSRVQRAAGDRRSSP